MPSSPSYYFLSPRKPHSPLFDKTQIVLSSKGGFDFIALPREDPKDMTTLVVDQWSHKRAHNNLHRTSLYCNLYQNHGLQVSLHCNGIGSGHYSHVSVSANVLKIKSDPHYRTRRLFRGNILITLESPRPCEVNTLGVITFDDAVQHRYCRKRGPGLTIEEFAYFDEIFVKYL